MGNTRSRGNQAWGKAVVLDPTKVTSTALQNPASIAGLMIATEAMVGEAEEG